MKQISIFLIGTILFLTIVPASIIFATEHSLPEEKSTPEETLNLTAPSAILMEAETKTVLYEKNSHEALRPASVTKVMTLLLIFEALESGKIHFEDTVTVSEHAADMGGSQVYLEPGETQTVNDLIKCISIASANDAAVTMAEYIDGTEEAFVAHMNKRAKELQMNDTTFVNCCGLEADGHLTSAYDIALMSRELSVKHPAIHDYCTIWMDQITHETRRGSTEFGLTNTNKLLRQYRFCTGLKTGYTSQSGFCLSATASRDDVNLIAVVMACENSKLRNKDAIALLDYGFSHCQVYSDDLKAPLPAIPIIGGKKDSALLAYASSFRYVSTGSVSFDKIQKKQFLPSSVYAPVKAGDVIGSVKYYIGKQKIGCVEILAKETIAASSPADCFSRCLHLFFLEQRGKQT